MPSIFKNILITITNRKENTFIRKRGENSGWKMFIVVRKHFKLRSHSKSLKVSYRATLQSCKQRGNPEVGAPSA